MSQTLIDQDYLKLTIRGPKLFNLVNMLHKFFILIVLQSELMFNNNKNLIYHINLGIDTHILVLFEGYVLWSRY